MIESLCFSYAFKIYINLRLADRSSAVIIRSVLWNWVYKTCQLCYYFIREGAGLQEHQVILEEWKVKKETGKLRKRECNKTWLRDTIWEKAKKTDEEKGRIDMRVCEKRSWSWEQLDKQVGWEGWEADRKPERSTFLLSLLFSSKRQLGQVCFYWR